MSQERTKTCVMCGKTIPAYANFCPYCGAKQPWLEENDGHNHRVDRIVRWNQTPGGRLLTIVVIVLVILLVGRACRLQDGPGHNAVARELNQYLFDSRDKTPFGDKPKIIVDKDKGVTIKISGKGTAIKNLKKHKPATWNRFVTRVTQRSKSFKQVYSNPLYSKFKVISKHDKKKTFLKVDQGKVTYNVAAKYK